ncbi:alpha/beta fold hydrolase [Pleionea sediminis]|uniref:alpha/beta fold hydrolase n=1 Tax=Pleionea sediminis TaxID=2569479 RepID=UPI001185C370|nr:alpha/beta hydrolase [Pleionea sediminis]
MIKKIFKYLGSLFAISLITFMIFAYLPENSKVTQIEKRATTQYWQLNRGFKIAFSMFGERNDNKAPIIFLHGGPGGYIHSSTIDTLKPLGNKGRAIYFYDQLGSGLSERPPSFSDVNFTRHIEDLHEIVTQHIKADKVILIGHSFGADLATHFIAHYPELVSKVVFSSPGGITPEHYDQEGFPLRYNIKPPEEYRFIEPWSYHKTSDSAIFRPKPMLAMAGALLMDTKLISDKEMDTLFNNLITEVTKGMVCDPKNVKQEEGGAGAYAYMSTNYNPEFEDIRPMLKSVEIPAITLHAQCDFIPYGIAIEFTELLGAKYYFIEKAGHIIWWEQPEIYFEIINKFVN